MPFFTYITGGQKGADHIPASSHVTLTHNFSGNNISVLGTSTNTASSWQTESYTRRETQSSAGAFRTAYEGYTYTRVTNTQNTLAASSFSTALTRQDGHSGNGTTALSQGACETQEFGANGISISWIRYLGSLTSESLFYNTSAARVEASVTESSRGLANLIAGTSISSAADTTSSYTSTAPVIQTSIVYFSKTSSASVSVTARRTSSSLQTATFTWNGGSATYPKTSVYTTTYTTTSPTKDLVADTRFIAYRGKNIFTFSGVAEWRQGQTTLETGQPMLFLQPGSFTSFIFGSAFPQQIGSNGSATFSFAHGTTMASVDGQSTGQTSSSALSYEVPGAQYLDLTWPSFTTLGSFSFDTGFGSSAGFVTVPDSNASPQTASLTWGYTESTVTMPAGSTAAAATRTYPRTLSSTSVHSLSTGNLTLSSYLVSTWTIRQLIVTTTAETFRKNFYYGSSTDSQGTTRTFPAASYIGYVANLSTFPVDNTQLPRLTVFVQPLVAGNFCPAGATMGYKDIGASGGDYSEMFTLSTFYQNGEGAFAPFSPIGFVPFAGATQRSGTAYTQAYSVSGISTSLSQTYSTGTSTASKTLVVFLSESFTRGTVARNDDPITLHPDCGSAWPYPAFVASEIYGTSGLDGTASYNLLDGLGMGLGASLSSFHFSGTYSAPASLAETSVKIGCIHEIDTFDAGWENYQPVSFTRLVNPTPW